MAEREGSRRKQILEAAAHAVAEHGFHGMSMRDLARRTRQAPATLYNYVDSKQELLFAIQRDAFEELSSRAERAVKPRESASQQLRSFVQSHVEFFAARPHLLRVLIHEAGTLPPRRRAEIRARKAAYFARAFAIVTALMRERRDAEPNPDQAECRTYCLFGMLNWTHGWYEPARHGTARELADAISEMALEGMANGSGETCR